MNWNKLEYWIELVTRRQTTVLVVAGTFFGVVLIGTLLWPPSYESSAEILVQKNRAQLLVSPDLGEDSQQKEAVLAEPVSEEELNSERELLTSGYLVRRALDSVNAQPSSHEPLRQVLSAFTFTLGLPTVAYDFIHGTPTIDLNDREVMKLMRNLGAAVVKRSDIIQVTFRSSDAKWSTDFLSLLISQYLEFHGQLSHDPQAEDFFHQQVTLLEARLHRSQDQLRAFQVQSGISNLGEQQQAQINRLSELELDQNKTAVSLASTAQQEESLTAQLARTPQRIGKETRSVQNLALQAIKPQVMQLRAERADLLSRYQPTSERIQEIDAKLAAAQRILDQEDHLEVTEQSTDLNPLWVTLETNLEQAKAQAAALRATADSLTGEITDIRKQRDQMVTNGVALERLEQQVASDKEAYLAYQRKAEEARAAGALNTDKILNVGVAEPPSHPLQPLFPNVTLNLVLGVIFGLGLGVLAAELEERTDPRIYSAYTIERTSGLKTFASLRDEA